MSNIKDGDVVYLKSGSLPMTVEKVRSDGKAECVWFDTQRAPQEKMYNLNALTTKDPHEEKGVYVESNSDFF